MYKQTITLSQLAKEVYDKTELGKSGVKMTKTSKDNIINKIKDITESLGIDIGKYYIKNQYRIPRIIADILIVYATYDSKKGSIISKIKNNDYKLITKEEKINLLNAMIRNLNERAENIEDIKDDIEDIKNKIMFEIEFSHRELESIENMKKDVKDKIDECFKNFMDIGHDNGLIIVNDDIYNKNIEYEKNIPYENRTLDVLSEFDKVIFIRHLKEKIDDAIDEWKELTSIANELKNAEIDDMIDYNTNSIIEGKSLLRKSIDEYKKKLIGQYENTKIEYNNEDMKKIIEDIKKDLDSRP